MFVNSINRFKTYCSIITMILFAILVYPCVNIIAQSSQQIEGTVNSINDTGIKVRRGPNVLYNTIGTLGVGDKVKILAISSGGNWLKIEYAGQGGAGWVFKRYIDFDKNAIIPTDTEFPIPTQVVPETLEPLDTSGLATPQSFVNTGSVQRSKPALGGWVIGLLALSAGSAIAGFIVSRQAKR